jgi:hypothetical protein
MTDLNRDMRYAGEKTGDDALPEHELDAERGVGAGITGSGGSATDTGTGSLRDQSQLDDEVVAPSDEHGLVDIPGDPMTDD